MTTTRILCSFAVAVSIAVGQSHSNLEGLTDLAGRPKDPFQAAASVRVFLFVRSDCPLTNRYAPELRRVRNEFTERGAEFWLVYPDPGENTASIEKHLSEYRLPGTPLRDTKHTLVKRAQVSVSPEAAVFDSSGQLVYSGRIDDRYIDFGKSRPAATSHDLEAAISSVLAHKPIAFSRTKAIGCYLSDIMPTNVK
jgi:hypothetical protein